MKQDVTVETVETRCKRRQAPREVETQANTKQQQMKKNTSQEKHNSLFFKMADPTRLYISGLPFQTTQDGLKSWLQSHGVVPLRMYLHYKDPHKVLCSGFLWFSEPSEDTAATLNGLDYPGGYVVKCQVAEARQFLGCILGWALWGGHLGWALWGGHLHFGVGTWGGHFGFGTCGVTFLGSHPRSAADIAASLQLLWC